MLLKSIELSGFKSFAKKSEFLFTSPISAIVGPNGSGKSNVAEAFRFVLGEQSIKSLRGKKGEDLIFNGASDGARANRASVKVIFDNSRRFLDIDFPEVSIERVVHRDGINEYFINGSLVRLKDIVELLSGAHIGASGHHIISQGEADRILNSNVRDRRAMIEDALGLKIYQYKREESERKLDKTLENIASVESLRREIAPHIRFLKKQVEKIEKAKELKQSLVDLAQVYLRQEDFFIANTRKDIEEKIVSLEKKKELFDNELREVRDLLESSKTKDAKSEEVIALEKKIHDVLKEKDTLLQDMGRLQGNISAEERLIEKQTADALKEEKALIPLSSLNTFKISLEQKIKEAETTNDISRLKIFLTEIRESLVSFFESHRTNKNEASLNDLKLHVDNLKKEKNAVEDRLNACRSTEALLAKEKTALEEVIEKEKDRSRDAEKTLFRIMAEQNNVSGALQVEYGRRESLLLVEEDFKREREECALLVGRDVLEYREKEAFVEERNLQEERRRSLEKLKIRLEDAGISSGQDILKEYEETSERDIFLERELEDLVKSAESLRALIKDLETTLDTEFKDGVEKINSQFQDFFSLMFGGGNAQLALVKGSNKRLKKDTDLLSLDVEDDGFMEEANDEEEGIDIEVSLPRKKIKGLMMLSGGERALTSIALLFAMSQVKPPPFIILDETDAALDEANSKKYGDMIESLSKYSQLILITHNRETMSRAGVIYGVTMGNGGISKTLSIQFDEAIAVAK